MKINMFVCKGDKKSMDEKIITRLEELVEQISECYASIPENALVELNELTGSGWTEEQYIEYCAEYWSRSTLEETVYALLHDGEYPDNPEDELYFWKNNAAIDFSDEEIMYKLRQLPETVDEDFVSHFDDLPVREIYEWLCSHFTEWQVDGEVDEEDMQSGSFEMDFNCDDIEYARYKYVMFEVCGNKVIGLDCCNLYENEKQDILEFANKHNLHVFER